jgi:hypothetical protein
MMIDLDNFFNEKNVKPTLLEIEHEGLIHNIESEIVIETILNTEGIERQKIAGILLSLEFRNIQIVEYLQQYGKSIIAKIVSKNQQK